MEFKIAIGGPICSFVLAFLFWIFYLVTSRLADLVLITGLLRYLAYINLALGIFNLIPGFPLDGGRVLRALYWKKTGSLRKATKIASDAGKWVGVGISVRAGVAAGASVCSATGKDCKTTTRVTYAIIMVLPRIGSLFTGSRSPTDA